MAVPRLLCALRRLSARRWSAGGRPAALPDDRVPLRALSPALCLSHRFNAAYHASAFCTICSSGYRLSGDGRNLCVPVAQGPCMINPTSLACFCRLHPYAATCPGNPQAYCQAHPLDLQCRANECAASETMEVRCRAGAACLPAGLPWLLLRRWYVSSSHALFHNARACHRFNFQGCTYCETVPDDIDCKRQLLCSQNPRSPMC